MLQSIETFPLENLEDPPDDDMFVADEQAEVMKGVEDCLMLQDTDVTPREARFPHTRDMMRRHEGSPPEAGCIDCDYRFRHWQQKGFSFHEVVSGQPPVQAGADDICDWEEVERV